MALSGALRGRVPAPVLHYARGLAMSIVHNVPAYGFSIVASATALVATVELGHTTVLDVFLFVLGAATAFAAIGALAALAFEEERVERASPKTLFIGSVLSFLSTSAGFGAALLVVHNLRGAGAWFLAPLVATAAYILVLALELELSSLMKP